MAGKPRKVRVAFHKNRQNAPQRPDLTRQVQREGADEVEHPSQARVSGKGDLTRYRTVITDDAHGEENVRRAVADAHTGRVLSARGAICRVQGEDGQQVECAVRRIVRTLAREERNAVVAGDRVLFRMSGDQGIIERVEPRQGILAREFQGRQHVLVANIEQVLIVVSADDPPLKPHLVDRYLVNAEAAGVQAVICINKLDLVDEAALQPIADLYRGLGYEVVLTSVQNATGIDRLREILRNRETAVTGQSGVGKSSLLNAIEPGLGLRTSGVSNHSRKGQHTTRSAQLLQLSLGGWVVDTPGIRQLELWAVHPSEVAGYFVEFPPHFAECRFPGCTHTHESPCGVKNAVERGEISQLRYDSFIKLITEEPPPGTEGSRNRRFRGGGDDL